jgi:dipeptidyl aminopeptidase/acylaminoacyl peptidase
MLAIRLSIFAAFLLALGAGCKPKDRPEPGEPGGAGTTLAEARKGFTTKLKKQHRANEPVDEPPAKVFRKVEYAAPVGKCAAYLTPDPKDGKKHPAIVWITGGDCNTIGDVWKPAPAKNDQTARQYREAGIVMMFPSLRGGNQNPGSEENFYGEVDDVLAAADFLAKQEYVDPSRIYLGGHSTGGTLVLLVAEVPNKFRAVFSFGPADDISGYPAQFIPAVNTGDDREVELRSPGRWLAGIETPTFVFEGADDGNTDSLEKMARASKNPKVHFYPVKGATHFSILAPVNRLVAQKVVADTGAEANVKFTEAELNKLFGR